MVQQFYQTEVNNEYVIRGNAAILKCAIPSFVADFVVVVSWIDSDGKTYDLGSNDDGKFGFEGLGFPRIRPLHRPFRCRIPDVCTKFFLAYCLYFCYFWR